MSVQFVHNDFGKKSGPFTAENAVACAANRAAHHADGQLEALTARCEELQGILGRLIEYVGERTHGRDDLAIVLGYGWERHDG